MSEHFVVHDDPENHRYVIDVNGVQAGFAVYHLRGGGRYFFVHTEIAEPFSGRGIGNSLVKDALDDVRSKSGVVIPLCPFFAGYIDSHPEYHDLVDWNIMERIDQGG